MHIAYVSDQRYPGTGTDRLQVVTMCSAFGAAGARVTLYYTSNDPAQAATDEAIAAHYDVAPTFATVPLAVSLCGRGPGPGLFRGLEKLTLAHRAAARIADTTADLVYSRNLPALLAGLHQTPLPTFYETYRPWPDQYAHMAMLFRQLARLPRFCGLILHSQLAADSYACCGLEPDRLLTARNGFNPSSLEPRLSRAQARQILDLPPLASDADPFTVAYVGDVTATKGVDLLCDLAARLPDVRFLLVGSKGQGPVERRARSLPNVQVFGWMRQAALAPYLYAADVLTIPPSATGLQDAGHTVLPIKAFLYLATGRPVLAGNTPDLREVIRHEHNGILVPPGDLAAAARALRLLQSDPDHRAQLGARALADSQNYTYPARARRVLDFLEGRLTAT